VHIRDVVVQANGMTVHPRRLGLVRRGNGAANRSTVVVWRITGRYDVVRPHLPQSLDAATPAYARRITDQFVVLMAKLTGMPV